MRLAFKIAFRFLKSSKGQTALILLGIAIGVSVQVFIGSLIQGLQKSLVDKTVGNSPQITLVNKDEDALIEDYKDITGEIEDMDGDITALSYAADGPGFINYKEDNYSILLRGFDIERANKIYSIKNRLVKGKLPDSKEDIIIGLDLKEDLGVELNEKIEIRTPEGSIKEFNIAGIFDLKVANINESWIITTLEGAQGLLGIKDTVTSIEIQVGDVFLADTIGEDIKEILPQGDFEVSNWKAQNEELLSGLSGQSVSSIMIQVFVMLSVVLGIASVLAISVVQKSKQIGILKAMGIKDRTSSLIFLFQGLLLGIGGAILGIVIGLGLSIAFTTFATNPDGSPIVELYIDYKFILLSGTIAILAATIASVIPARNSSKLNPIEVIRNG